MRFSVYFSPGKGVHITSKLVFIIFYYSIMGVQICTKVPAHSAQMIWVPASYILNFMQFASIIDMKRVGSCARNLHISKK